MPIAVRLIGAFDFSSHTRSSRRRRRRPAADSRLRYRHQIRERKRRPGANIGGDTPVNDDGAR